MITFKRALSFTLFCLVADRSMAAGVPLSDVSNTLLIGGNILSKVLWAACIVVGILLIAAAFTQFQIHRRNSKLVPLTTPVLYLILGVVSISIPFIERVSGFLDEKNSSSTTAASQRDYQVDDIDAPLD